MNKKLLGTVAVDSGKMMVVDPCYTKYFDKYEAQLYIKNGRQQQLKFPRGENAAVTTSTGHGDASYPAYTFEGEDGRLKWLVVALQPDIEPQGVEE